MADLNNPVFEIKTVLTQNNIAKPPHIHTAHSAKSWSPAKENLDEIRITGILESKKDDASCWEEHDFNEVRKVWEYIKVEAATGEVTQLDRGDTNHTRTVLIEVPNPCQRRMIILRTRKLLSSGGHNVLSRQLS